MLGTNQLFRYQVVELKGADLDHALDQISSSSNFYRNPMEAEIIKRKVEYLSIKNFLNLDNSLTLGQTVNKLTFPFQAVELNLHFGTHLTPNF